ncbi:hypothetical protein MWU77_21640 [Rhodococcus sp. F64268]|uniref:hypothetical protein n=1 Tax=Rhodococcus sp. F64268 TaxID=2926402 RepID=UPI001FF0F08B|nr:hypothetical protein [Rhodococcus sp. F64268]MCK0093387.1 hypothetical protein [Rhodococcus sp. F64268]
MFEKRVLGLLSILVLLTPGCTNSPNPGAPEPSEPPADPPLPFTNSWSAEPDIDLFSRGAELVRASIEAGIHASFFSVSESFPGYSDAIGYQHVNYNEIADTVARGRPRGGWISDLTYLYHIAEITETPTSIIAEVCDEPVTVDPYISDHRVKHGFSWIVALTNTGGAAGLPGVVDTDPDGSDPRARRVPDWNVFGAWNITQLRTGGRDASTAIAHPACTEWWLERHPGSEVLGNYTFSPAGEIPGEPRLPQYPEWIGPSETQ